ncbi:MAG: YhdP family protein [Legionellaceae bacterium]|nr:YhdP family protein [Legionellaceae bacterium]
MKAWDRVAQIISERMPVRFVLWLKRIWMACAILLVIFAIIVSIFRALTPWAAQYKTELETRLTTLLGAPVSIQDMKTSWYWFEPVLKLDGVLVSEQEASSSVLELKALLVGIDLMRSLLHWRIQPGVLFIEDGRLNLKQGNEHWALEGSASDGGIKADASTDFDDLLAWLLAHQKIVMKRVGVTLHWQDGRVTPIKPLTIVASNHDGHYRVKGHASLEGEQPSVVSLLADLDLSSGFTSGARGSLYLSAERVDFSEWRSFFKPMPYQITEGRGEFQLWLDLRNARPTSAHAVVRMRDLVWKESTQEQAKKIDRFSANMVWEGGADGWRWSADHVRLKAGKTTWPENAMTLDYKAEEQRYRVFVKTILLGPTRELLQDGPEVLQPLLAMKPRGQLNNTQLGFQDGKLDYVLSRFSHISWHERDKIPAVNQLSGALAWEPKEGRLALDGENVRLSMRNRAPLVFDLVNATVVWKALSHGWRVSFERGVLQHPNGVFSARGVLDDVSRDSAGTLQGDVSFALHDATFWLPYLPEEGIKPKLKTWIQHDITRVDQASGRVHVQGPLKTFPFDDGPGDFLITGSMSGVDLRFNPNWPLTKDVSATLHLDKRTLAADVSQAMFQGMPMEHANLRVTDLGLGREVLSVRSEATAPCEDMLGYIANSPLHERLAKLDSLMIKRPAVLSLAMDFPFYPGPDKLKVQGRVDFQDNDLFVKDLSQTVGLHHLSGALPFDEHGVLPSYLTAQLFNEPIKLDVHPVSGAEHGLAIDMDGHLSVNGLQDALSMPVLALMQGRVAFNSQVVITDDPDDLDKVTMSSSLEGLDIALPAPLGKTREEQVPLKVGTYFNLTRGARLSIDYHKRLSADVWFDGKTLPFYLARGEVFVGDQQAVLSKKSGVTLRGELNRLDWEPWQAARAKLSEPLKASGSTTWFDSFRTVAFKFNEVEVFNQHYKHMKLNAHRTPGRAWSITMSEEAASASLTYDTKHDSLGGYVSRWVVAPSSLSESHESKWKPNNIPNIDLTLGSLLIGDVDAGKLSLKGKRLDEGGWRLESGALSAENYEFMFSGGWQEEPKPQTLLDARLKINDLEKALNYWGVSPVVEAKSGDLKLSGRWDGSPDDFSLKNITGNMHIIFKDGRITHLSPETEKKMGLGKLLSILSLQTIPRRLKLDFSDLSKSGYSFDKFEGNFVLAHGIMDTEDSDIDGPVARATMKGSLDLDKHLYDISLHISPHITASLPIVATIAGGPVAGIATWVASKLINQGMEKISGYTYDVSGPWLEPVVQQVHIYRKPIVQKEDAINLKVD